VDSARHVRADGAAVPASIARIVSTLLSVDPPHERMDGDAAPEGRADEGPVESDGAASAVDTSPEEAFARLGNEIRLSILQELYERLVVGDRTDSTVAHSELRAAVGESDSGKFTYHLNRLIGDLVEKRPGGYVIRYPGRELVRTIRSGAVEAPVRVESDPVDADCHRCGAPVTVVYEHGYVSTRCTTCRGTIDLDHTPEGTLSSISVPAGAVGDAVETAPADLLDRVHSQFCHRARAFGDGVCPRCGGAADAEIRTCPDHDPTAGPCEECGIAFPATVEASCRVCGDRGVFFGGCAVGHRAPFREALADAGVDRLGYDAFAVMAEWVPTPADRAGETALAFDLPTVEGRVVVDPRLDVHVGE